MKERLWYFIAMLLVAFQLLVALPIAVWLHNQFNFSAALGESITLFWLLFATIFLISLLLAFITPGRIRKRVYPAIVFVSLLIYLQQYLLVWDYGILDGQSIDFSKNSTLGLIDAGLWLLGLVIFFSWRKKIHKHSRTILSFSVLLTAVASLTTISTHDFSDDGPTGSVNDAGKFTFSQDKNILLFLLDGFQSDLFWDLIDQHPDLQQDLDGFTFYANTSGVFAKTYPTIPLLLTGNTYKKEEPFREFQKGTYRNSILADLKGADWDVRLFPYVEGTIELDDSIMSNYLASTTWPEVIDNYLQALGLSLFQSVPHQLKHHIYSDGEFINKSNFADLLHKLDNLFPTDEVVEFPNTRSHQGLSFQDNLAEFGSANFNAPVFRFYHLFMPHAPFLLNGELETIQPTGDFSAYKDYAHASIQLMIKYLDSLKRLGAYDNSFIIIAADHGGGEYTHNLYNSSNRGYTRVSEHGDAIASGKPLLMIKNPSESGTLRISSKPVSLVDVAPTIAKYAGINADHLDGLIIDDVREDQQRERRYYHYSFSGWDSKFLNDFEIFTINGHAFDEDAWALTGHLTSPRETSLNRKYTLGNTIRFGLDTKTNADLMNAFLVGDEYIFETSKVVSPDGEFMFSLQLDTPLKEHDFLLMETDISSFGEPANVTLELEQKEVHTFTVSKPQKQLHLLDVKHLKNHERLNWRLYVSDHDADGKEIAISSLSLEKTTLVELDNNSVISFSDNLDELHVTGMSKSAAWGRWTLNTESGLHFYATGGFCENSYMLLEINRFYQGINPDSFAVVLNDRKLRLVKVDNTSGPIKQYLDCSWFDSSDSGITSLEFRTDKVLSPAITGTGPDVRSLGVALRGFRFVPKEEAPTQ